MAYKIITKCPVCTSDLSITRLKCRRCNTVIENEFQLTKFSYLTEEQLNFAEIFLKCRGNIKDVEKEMGISYPTVRARLDDVITALGYSVSKKTTSDSNQVLDLLEKGEISPEQALNMLKE